MSRRVIPLFDRVLIQRVKAAERTASGLFIPEKAQETLNEGIVVEVGQGKEQDGKTIPLFLKKGDLVRLCLSQVLMPPFGGSSVKLNDQEYHLFKESELLAKLTK